MNPALMLQLRTDLQQTGDQYGALFRVVKNGHGRAVSYQTVQER